MTKRTDVYEMVTNKVLEALEEGTIPWQKPWEGGASQAPRNYITQQTYRGVNILLLGLFNQFESNEWLTFKQAKQKKAHVLKGSKGTPIVYFSWAEKTIKDEKTGEEREERYCFLKYFTVFNLQQTSLWEGAEEFDQGDFEPISEAHNIWENWEGRPKLQHAEQSAYYRPSADVINMPAPASFHSSEQYYSTLFHEMTHATGSEDRLNRKTLTELNAFGSHEYSKEELVAEMGAGFLCAHAGIANSVIEDNSAAYIQSWLKVLKAKDNSKWIIQAAQQAQKAVDLILGEE